MKLTRITEEQIIGVLKGAEAGTKTAELARRGGVSEATIHNWKVKYGGLEVSDAKRLWALGDENARLKRLLAEAMLDNAGLKDLLAKIGGTRCQGRSGRTSPGLSDDERAADVLYHRC